MFIDFNLIRSDHFLSSCCAPCAVTPFYSKLKCCKCACVRARGAKVTLTVTGTQKPRENDHIRKQCKNFKAEFPLFESI